jgi:predicted nucleic acid-binding protein
LIVVSNSSPLISLSRIGRLDLLPKLFGFVHVSHQVYEEVANDVLHRPGSRQVVEAAWIVREEVEVAGEGPVHFPTSLGVGEVTSILLAQRLKADWIILDDGQARKAATKAGLQVIGCVGILDNAALLRCGLPPIRD